MGTHFIEKIEKYTASVEFDEFSQNDMLVLKTFVKKML